MKPYKHIKLEQFPDVADIQADGRKSSVGKISGKSGECRSYIRSSQKKKATRRILKHKDKAKADRQQRRDAE